MGVKMDLEGMNDVAKYFERYRNPTERAPVKRAMLEAGEMIAREARARIDNDSGELEEAIAVQTTQGAKSIRTKVHTGSARHGSPVEYGHAPSGWNKGDQDVLPQPFLWPAFEAKKNAALREITDAVAAVLINNG